VQPLDLVTFSGAALVLASVAVAAAVLPAWRAARVDPAVALRQE
jgi:putative ABC transport system permease protein